MSESNVDGENGLGLGVSTTGALSNILSNEEAFQKIDMELEGHMHTDKGLHEVGADFEEVRLMVEESSMADVSTGGMASSGQPSLDVTKASSLMEQVDGCQPIHTNLVEHDQNETGTLLEDLGQSNRGLGPITRTWKGLQV